MSGSLTVIGGHTGSVLTGLVSVPSNFTGSIEANLQTLLSLASGVVTSGAGNLVNVDVVGSSTFTTTPSVPGGTLLEITNTDSTGAISPGTLSGYSATVPSGVVGLVVEAPGAETVIGNGTTSVALFGANSNVDYSVLTGSGSIFAAGGADSINIGAAGNATTAYALYTTGNDTINLISGLDTVDATSGTALVNVQDAQATVTADGNSSVSVVFKPLTGGTMDFINNSSGAATIFTGAYTLPGGAREFATNAVTAYGGAGGGFYVGGQAGGNSLVGGSGVVTLVGAGNNDVLESNSSVGGTNQLFSGTGSETLLGSATSGSNTFQLNLKYVGVGTITGSDFVSTEGSGTQSFLMGAGDSTITGSTVAGSVNVFDLVRDASVGSANYTITNFASIGGAMFITDSSLVAGHSSVFSSATVNFGTVGDPNYVTTVTLTDQTTIKFDGVQASNLTISTDTTNGVIAISYHA